MKYLANCLDRKIAGLMIIDVQDCLVAAVDRGCEVVQSIITVVKGCEILGIPMVISEQYPKGLGPTTLGVKKAFEKEMPSIHEKTSFSCLGDLAMNDYIRQLPITQWILVGMEAHVCVYLTARDLIKEGYEVTVLNDCITSRSVFDFSTAIAELRDVGARVACTETVLFELLGNASVPEFRAISQLVR